MFFSNIEDVILEKNVVCFSPHYNDFLFFLGGWILEMKKKCVLKNKKITNINIFSRTNYLRTDNEKNHDISMQRIKHATGIRLIEDLECLDELIGKHEYYYRVMGEEDSNVRGKAYNEGDCEVQNNYYETMQAADWSILKRMQIAIDEIASNEDTAIVLPLSMKGHIDHFVIREAGLAIMKQKSNKAAFYFAEDKPYAGIMNEKERKENEEFIEDHDLLPRAFTHHCEEVLRLAFSHFQNQVVEVYNVGVTNRNEQLKKLYNREHDVDRIFRFEVR